MKTRTGQTRPKNSGEKRKTTQSPRKWRPIVLLCILALLLAGFWYRGGVTGIAIGMAETAIKNWQLESASGWLAFSEKLGQSSKVQFLLARVARLNNDPDIMRQHLVKAHELGSAAAPLNREQELLRISYGEIDSLLDSKAKQWIAEQPADLGLVVDAYANGLAAQSRFSEAALVLENYEQLYPEDPMVNFRLGVMNEHLRSSAKAEDEYRIAMQKDPNYIRAAWSLARLRSSKNAPQEAIEILKPHEKGKPVIAVRTMLAHCNQQLGDLDRSRELFKSVADLGFQAGLESYSLVDDPPERFLAASELGVLDTKMGNWEEARKYLELALDVNPRDFVARNSYAQVLRRLGLQDRAEKELARITEERSEYDKITVLREQIGQNPADVDARVQMGKILFKYESTRFGLFWIRSALTYDPKCTEAHQFLGDYYRGKAEAATSPTDVQYYESKARFHFGQLEDEATAPSTAK